MNVISNNSIKCTVALATLQQVMDPELELNVVDLGLLYQIDFSDAEKKIFVRMTLTTQFCPMGQSILDGVTRAMQSAFPADAIQVELTFEPPWNHQRISKEGLEFLNQ